MNTTLKTMYTRFTSAMTDEQGAEMVEWIGMLAVVLIALGVVGTAVEGGQHGKTFVTKLNEAVSATQMQGLGP